MSDDSDESNSFEVTVLLADGKEVRVEVRPDDTIEDVKERLIAEIEGSSWQVGRWSPELITLASGHLPLNDDDTVAESGLRAESAIVQHYTTPDGSGTIDYTIAGTFPQGTSSDWTTSIAFEPSTTESERTSGHDNRFLELGYNRLKSCDICGLKDDETKWRVVEPQVSERDLHFRIYLPEEGFYECFITGLRWEIKSAITIAYRYCSWNEYAPIIVIKETEYCGPLFNIVAEDNVVTAIHLPHFVCLKDRHRKNIFAIFYVREQSYRVQKPSEVHEAHVELQMPTFSLLGVIIDKTSQFSCHSLTVIYQTQYTDAAVLHIYVVPHDFSVIQAVHKQESESTLIKHPSQITSLYFGRKYSVKSYSKVQIAPDEMKFQCTDMDSNQPFYEVIITEEPSSFELKLTKRKKEDPLWQIALTFQNGKVSSQENLDEDVSQKKGDMPLKKDSLTSEVRSSASDEVHIFYADLTDPLENIDVDPGSASPTQLSSDTTVPSENIDVDPGSTPPVRLSSDTTVLSENIDVDPGSTPPVRLSSVPVGNIDVDSLSTSPVRLSSELEISETYVNATAKQSDSSSDGEKAGLSLFGPSDTMADAGLDFYEASEYFTVLSFGKFDLIGSCHHLQAVDLEYDSYPILLTPPIVETPVEALCRYIIEPEDVCECITGVTPFRAQKDAEGTCKARTDLGSSQQDSKDTCKHTADIGPCCYHQGILEIKGPQDAHRKQDPEAICRDETDELFEQGTYKILLNSGA
ncbi:uncharacterized protein LOC129709482 isoform X1 [Leucoraja erinacea]|uniref:uncharacterized protein LOC129709482 isoform X1 n=1 Tax=Leucoraja erinaceus TaxID=7782 RepID=UPI0024580164|nr:uncharacterized protein LOC129709482 isoform X1 [Leucoraja erinacea]